MKKIALILVMILFAAGSQAQKLVIGAKMPDLKGVEWIGKAPQGGKAVYLDFFQSTNATCNANLEKIKALRKQYPQMNVVLLTRENGEAVQKLAQELGDGFYVAYDADGKKYDAFGVKFVPFSMIFDSKSVLKWQGNVVQLKPDQIKGL